MNLEVNQDNLYLFIPSKISLMADMLISDQNISVVEAIKRIYKSQTYKLLEDESTKKWHSSPVDLYRDFLDEEESKYSIK